MEDSSLWGIKIMLIIDKRLFQLEYDFEGVTEQ